MNLNQIELSILIKLVTEDLDKMKIKDSPLEYEKKVKLFNKLSGELAELTRMESEE